MFCGAKREWIYCLFLLPAFGFGQSWQKFGPGLISCKERAAIISDLNSISYISLDSQAAKWQVITKDPLYSTPLLAGNTLLILANSFQTIYAFSKTTGKQLWRKNTWKTKLASDGSYFYLLDPKSRKLQALDPASGAVVWSLRLPGWRSSTRERPEYIAFLRVHNGLLFTGDLVIDISRRAIVHRWPMPSFNVSSADFADDGSIFLAGSWGTSGMIAIYDRNFNRIRKFRAGKGEIGEIWSRGEQMLVLLEYSDSYGRQTTLVSLTREGKTHWRVQWPARSMGFSVAGSNVLIIEPGKIYGDFRLTSRQLSTGKSIWATGTGDFYGAPFLCRNTVYVADGDRLSGFDLHTGKETTTGVFVRH